MLHVGDVPAIDPATWRLRVFGQVAEPFELSYDELRAMPASEFRGDIHCVTRWSKLDTYWIGVRFSAIAARAKPLASARFVVQHADNDYTTNLPLDVMLDDDVLVAYEFDGRPIEPIHGGPCGCSCRRSTSGRAPSGCTAIEFRDTDQNGFWEVRGYNNDADPWKEERYADLPAWFA